MSVRLFRLLYVFVTLSRVTLQPVDHILSNCHHRISTLIYARYMFSLFVVVVYVKLMVLLSLPCVVGYMQIVKMYMFFSSMYICSFVKLSFVYMFTAM